MISKKSFSAYRLILGAFFLTAVIAVSCNNGTEKKEPATDTPKVETPAPPVIDTPKVDKDDTAGMEKATTRPVKTTD